MSEGNKGRIVLSAALEDGLTPGLRQMIAEIKKLLAEQQALSLTTRNANSAIDAQAQAQARAKKAAEEEILVLKAKIAALKGDQAATEAATRALREHQRAALAAATGDEDLTDRVIALREEHERLIHEQKRQAQAQEELRQATHTLGIAFAALGAIIVGAYGLAIKKATDFEFEMAKVSTVADTNEAGLQGLRKELLALSPALGDAADLARGLYITLQAGITDPKKAMETLVTSAKFAKANIADLAQAIDLSTSILAAYGMEAQDMSRVNDILTKTIQDGKIEVNDFVQGLGMVIPTAAALKVPLEEIGASLVVMTRQGIQTDHAVISLNQVLTSFLDPTKEASKLAQELGFNLSAGTIQSQGLAGAIGDLAKKISGINDKELRDQAIAIFFGNVRAMRGAMALTGEQAGLFGQELEALKGAAGETNIAFEKLRNSLKEQAKETLSNLTNLAIEVGSTFIPALKAINDPLNDLISWFRDLDDSTKAIVSILGLGAGATLGLTGVILLLLPRIEETRKAFVALKAATDAGRLSFLGFNSAMMANPIILIGSLLIALEVNFKLVSGAAWYTVVAVQAVWKWLAELGTRVGRMIIDLPVLGKILSWIGDVINRWNQSTAGLNKSLEENRQNLRTGTTEQERHARAAAEAKKQQEGMAKATTEASKAHKEGTSSTRQYTEEQLRAQAAVEKETLTLRLRIAELKGNTKEAAALRKRLEDLTAAGLTAKTGNEAQARTLARLQSEYAQLTKATKSQGRAIKEQVKDTRDLEKVRAAEEKYFADRFLAQVNFNASIAGILAQAAQEELAIDRGRVDALRTNSAMLEDERIRAVGDYVQEVRSAAQIQMGLEQELAEFSKKTAEDEWTRKAELLNEWLTNFTHKIKAAKIPEEEKARLILKAETAQFAKMKELEDDWSKHNESTWQTIYGFGENALAALASFFKDFFVGVVTADLKKIKNAFFNFFRSILKALEDTIAAAIARWIVAKIGIERILDAIWKKIKDVFGNKEVYDPTKDFVEDLTSATLSLVAVWTAFNAQLLLSRGLLAGLSLEQARASSEESILRVRPGVGSREGSPNAEGTLGDLGDQLSIRGWGRLGQIVTVIGAIVGFLGTLAGIFGGGGGKPHQVGLTLRTDEFEGLVYDQLNGIQVGLIDIYVSGIKRLTKDMGESIAGRVEAIIRELTFNWARVFNRFPDGVISAILPSLEAANQGLAEGLDRIVLVTRDNFQGMVNAFVNNLSRRMAREYTEPLKRAIEAMLAIILPVGDTGSELSGSLSRFLDKFSAVGPKLQGAFGASVSTITDALASIHDAEALLDPRDTERMLQAFDAVVDSTLGMGPRQIEKANEGLAKFQEYVAAVVDFQREQQAIIDEGTLSEFASGMARLREEFAESQRQADELQISHELLNRAYGVQLLSLAGLKEMEADLARGTGSPLDRALGDLSSWWADMQERVGVLQGEVAAGFITPEELDRFIETTRALRDLRMEDLRTEFLAPLQEGLSSMDEFLSGMEEASMMERFQKAMGAIAGEGDLPSKLSAAGEALDAAREWYASMGDLAGIAEEAGGEIERLSGSLPDTMVEIRAIWGRGGTLEEMMETLREAEAIAAEATEGRKALEGQMADLRDNTLPAFGEFLESFTEQNFMERFNSALASIATTEDKLAAAREALDALNGWFTSLGNFMGIATAAGGHLVQGPATFAEAIQAAGDILTRMETFPLEERFAALQRAQDGLIAAEGLMRQQVETENLISQEMADFARIAEDAGEEISRLSGTLPDTMAEIRAIWGRGGTLEEMMETLREAETIASDATAQREELEGQLVELRDNLLPAFDEFLSSMVERDLMGRFEEALGAIATAGGEDKVAAAQEALDAIRGWFEALGDLAGVAATAGEEISRLSGSPLSTMEQAQSLFRDLAGQVSTATLELRFALLEQMSDTLRRAEEIASETTQRREDLEARITDVQENTLPSYVDFIEAINQSIAEISRVEVDWMSEFDRMLNSIHTAEDDLTAAQGAMDAIRGWFESLGDLAGIAERAGQHVIDLQTATAEGMMARIALLTGAPVTDFSSAMAANQQLMAQIQGAPLEDRAPLLSQLEESLRLTEQLREEEMRRREEEINREFEERKKLIDEMAILDPEEAEIRMRELETEREQALADLQGGYDSSTQDLIDAWTGLQEQALAADAEAQEQAVDMMEQVRAEVELQRLSMEEELSAMNAELSRLIDEERANAKFLLSGWQEIQAQALAADQEARDILAAKTEEVRLAVDGERAILEAQLITMNAELGLMEESERANAEFLLSGWREIQEEALTSQHAADEAQGLRDDDANVRLEALRLQQEQDALALQGLWAGLQEEALAADAEARDLLAARTEEVRLAIEGEKIVLEAQLIAMESELALLRSEEGQHAQFLLDGWRRIQEDALMAQDEADQTYFDHLTSIREAVEVERAALESAIREMDQHITDTLLGTHRAPGEAFFDERPPGVPAQHGLDFVPRDDFPVRAHRGEAVLTARGNRALGEILEEIRGAGTGQTIHVHLNLDGRELTEVVIENLRKHGEAGRRVLPDRIIYKHR